MVGSNRQVKVDPLGSLLAGAAGARPVRAGKRSVSWAGAVSEVSALSSKGGASPRPTKTSQTHKSSGRHNVEREKKNETQIKPEPVTQAEQAGGKLLADPILQRKQDPSRRQAVGSGQWAWLPQRVAQDLRHTGQGGFNS